MSAATKRMRYTSIARPIVYGSVAIPLTPEEKIKDNLPQDHTHRWTVALRSAAPDPSKGDKLRAGPGGGDDAVLARLVKRVVIKLHETIPNPSRGMDQPPFSVTETGWGEFDIQIKVFFTPECGAEKPVTFYHHLKLHPWDSPVTPAPAPALHANGGATGEGEDDVARTTGSPSSTPGPATAASVQATSNGDVNAELKRWRPVHSWQYDELVLPEPTDIIFQILSAQPPSALPPAFTVSSNVIPLTLDGKMIFRAACELTQAMEKDEFDRLGKARKKIKEQTNDLKRRLAVADQNLKTLKSSGG